jgi:hypothetical protein
MGEWTRGIALRGSRTEARYVCDEDYAQACPCHPPWCLCHSSALAHATALGFLVRVCWPSTRGRIDHGVPSCEPTRALYTRVPYSIAGSRTEQGVNSSTHSRSSPEE